MKKIITKGKIKNIVVTTEALLGLLNIPSDVVKKFLRLGPILYKDVLISKKAGKFRPISIPRNDLKSVQKAIVDKMFSRIKLPFCVYGFSKSKTIIENAKYHAESDFLLNLDIKNFFPSVHFEKIKQMYKDIGCEDALSEILCKLTTYKYSLPQGAPTSPFLASLALNNLDNRLMKLAKKNYISYTRYFDDMSFSGSKRVEKLEQDIVQIILEEGYKINQKRQLFVKGQIKEVNGISIELNGRLFLKNTNDLCSYANDLKEFGFSKLKSNNPEKERLSLLGKINFLKQVDLAKGKDLKVIFDSIKW